MAGQDQELPSPRVIEDIEELQSKLALRFSSEFNTPLSIVKEGLTLLTKNLYHKIDSKDQKILHLLTENVDRLAQSMNHFLEICRIEAGQMEFKRKPLSVNQLLADVEKNFAKAVAAQKLKWRVIPFSKDNFIYGNSQYLLEVFRLLVENSVKFTPKGSVEVAVKEDPKHIEFMVSDTGVGIAVEHRLHLFEKFEQHWPYADRPPEGLGLGLTIAKAIVTHHQGRIWIDESYSKGTRMIFTIPRDSSKKGKLKGN